MPKSKIIKELVDGSVSMETSLNRLYLLAHDVGQTDLMEWAQKEIKGYGEEDVLPDYRITKSYSFIYSGINGRLQVKNVPLPTGFIKAEFLEAASEVKVYDGIIYVEKLASAGETLYRDMTTLASQVLTLSHGTIQCTQIQQEISCSLFQSICSNVRERIINELLALEKQFGSLDKLEIQSDYDPSNVYYWNNIHPRICNVAKELFENEFYDSAAEKAIKEVETCLREMFGELKPGAKEPSRINDIIGALLSENGAYKHCDISMQSGQDFCRGFRQICEGMFAAYRNPNAHRNITMQKREAFERITLASMIMYVLKPIT